jgi:hypothetical protein
MADSDTDTTTVTEDPTIIDSEPQDKSPKGYLATEEGPTELASVTFEAGGTERTISVGERLIADNGEVIGEIKQIHRPDHDPTSRIHAHGVIHWVYIDYGVGEYWDDTSSTGGLPLGETAKQMADGDMTTER